MEYSQTEDSLSVVLPLPVQGIQHDCEVTLPLLLVHVLHSKSPLVLFVHVEEVLV